jgi:hypothetical protein
VEKTILELAVELINPNICETTPEISKKRVVKVHFETGVHRMLLRAFLQLAKAELLTDPHICSGGGFIATEKSLADLSGMAVAHRTQMVEMVGDLQRNPIEWLVYDQNSQLAEKRRFAVIQEARFLDGGRIRFFLAPTLLEVLQLSCLHQNPDSTQCLYQKTRHLKNQGIKLSGPLRG